MVPCLLGLAGVQPLIGAASGGIETSWATALALPALAGAALVFVGWRILDRDDSLQPPWYSAWVLLPGAFVLVGAASMCLFGALVEYPLIASALWMLLAVGIVLWSGALMVVRLASH
jgi:uncharacterized membrane protein YgdD (TMEM256/DUF423 family)